MAPYVRKCSVRGCTVTSESLPTRNFYKIPTKNPRRTQWLINIGREDLFDTDPRYFVYIYKVCGDHFSNEQFSDSLRVNLKKSAIPDIVFEPSVTVDISISGI